MIKHYLYFLLFFLLPFSVQGQESTENKIKTSDGVQLYTKKSGKGPVLLFVHGGPGTWSKSFEELGGQSLEGDFSIIYYDQRGCGRSESDPKSDYSIDRMLSDMDEIREFYNTENLYVMGHSFGGILASLYAQQYPEHVKGLILLNATLSIRDSIENQAQFMRETLGVKVAQEEVPADIMERFTYYQNQMIAHDILHLTLTLNKDNYNKLNQIDAGIPSDFAFAKKVFSLPEYLRDYTIITPTIITPTLVFTGQQDFAIGIKHYQKFRFPNQKVVHFASGHLAYFEENQLLNSQLKKFITENP